VDHINTFFFFNVIGVWGAERRVTVRPHMLLHRTQINSKTCKYVNNFFFIIIFFFSLGEDDNNGSVSFFTTTTTTTRK
jgi:hypothetical protein